MMNGKVATAFIRPEITYSWTRAVQKYQYYPPKYTNLYNSLEMGLIELTPEFHKPAFQKQFVQGAGRMQILSHDVSHVFALTGINVGVDNENPKNVWEGVSTKTGDDCEEEALTI